MSFSSLLAASTHGGAPSVGLSYSLGELSSLPSVSAYSDGDIDGAYRLLSGGGFDAGRFEEGIAEMDVIGDGTGSSQNLESFLSNRHSSFIDLSLKKSAYASSEQASALTQRSRAQAWSEEKKVSVCLCM